MAQYELTPGGLLIPGGARPRKATAAARSSGSSGQHRSSQIGTFRYWAADGLIHFEDTVTGKYDSMMPDRALRRVRDMAKNLLGHSLESSICHDRAERNEMLEAMRALEELAKQEMARQPERLDG